MKAQVLEGTFAEIQKQISGLPYKPDTRLRVVATALDAAEPETSRFENAERRNGLILFSTLDRDQLITTEFVNELLNEE